MSYKGWARTPVNTEVLHVVVNIADPQAAAVDVMFVVTVEFEAIGLRRPSSQQLMVLFERLHEADVRTARLSETLFERGLPPPRARAEGWLLHADGAPRVEYVLYENPGKVRKIVAGFAAAAALATATAQTLNASADAIRAADRVVVAAQQMEQDIARLGADDHDAESSRVILSGQGQDPEIRVVRISVSEA